MNRHGVSGDNTITTNDSDSTLFFRSVCIPNIHLVHKCFTAEETDLFREMVRVPSNHINHIELKDSVVSSDPDHVEQFKIDHDMIRRGPAEIYFDS